MELSDLFLSGEVKFNERRKGMETSRTQHGLPTSYKVNSPELYVSKNERRIGIVYGRVVNKLERVLFFLTAGRTPVDGDGDLK